MERQLTHHHFVQHDAERPDVGPLVHVFTPGLVRRHVSDGSDGSARLRHRFGSGQLRQTEVEDFGYTFCGHDQGGRFDIAVNDAGSMCLTQANGNLVSDELWSVL